MQNSSNKPEKRGARRLLTLFAVVALLACAAFLLPEWASRAPDAAQQTPSPSPIVYETGYLRSDGSMIAAYIVVCDEAGATHATQVNTLCRGTQVRYAQDAQVVDGLLPVSIGKASYYVPQESVVSDAQDVLAEETLYMRTAQNLLCDPQGGTLGALVAKGTQLTVTGYDEMDDTGAVRLYRVQFTDSSGAQQEGYVRPWYVTADAQEALRAYDEAGVGAIHASRPDRYGGGDGAGLDYYPRQKGDFSDNVMPQECRTLYLCCYKSVLADVDSYIALADRCGINAFVVDISDGAAIGYASPLMQEVSPTSYAAAQNSVEEYAAAIEKLRNAGYYVIGRITTFNDTCFVTDHPECGILDAAGAPIQLQGNFWPSAYNRATWQYKVALAREAVTLFGFDEIQFDYVRFPDGTYRHEQAGTINYQNAYGETKAQAIQRFLMYACDELHEMGVYVSADVFGETSNDYVAAYGQYWPAISNVVDVISAMPYPDHYGASGSYKPWEHPYETLSIWAAGAVQRQSETPTPAVVRTWIQAYDAIRAPYTTYGPEQVGAQIRAIRDAGITGGYMTWNGSSNLWKYTSLESAFNL